MSVVASEFVREKHRKRDRVTARQVLDFLLEKKRIEVEQGEEGKCEKKQHGTAHRNVRHHLESQDCHRGKRAGNIAMKDCIAHK